MFSVKQGGIKYYFLSLWYDSTWDLTRSLGPLANTTRILSFLVGYYRIKIGIIKYYSLPISTRFKFFIKKYEYVVIQK